MAETARYSIGLDLGGTNLRAAAIDSNGALLGRLSGQTRLDDGRDAVLDDMVLSIRALRDEHGAERLVGIGVAVPGFIRIREGIVAGSNNLPAFDNFPMRDAIGARLGSPVILENDANAAALGEKWMGAGKDVEDLVLLTLGTGIGGGIIINGEILHGFVGMAAELGHVTVIPNGNPCGCGNIGCLEKHASATAVSAMAQMLQLGDNLSAKGVFEIAMHGPEDQAWKARRIFESMGSALGIAIASMVNIFNAPLYLISGGPLPAWELFAPAMMNEIRNRSFTFRNTPTRVEKALLGNEAGLFGAAYLPLQQAAKSVAAS